MNTITVTIEVTEDWITPEMLGVALNDALLGDDDEALQTLRDTIGIITVEAQP